MTIRLTTAITYGMLGIASAVSCTLPDSLPAVHAAAAPAGAATMVYVTDSTLSAIEYPSGAVSERFIRAAAVRQVEHEGRAGGMRVTVPGGPAPRFVRPDSDAAFADRLAQSLRDNDLGHLLDVADGRYSIVIEFERSLRDDSPSPDDVGELLLFERGRGAGDSWFVLQAVDESGLGLGRPLLVGPADLAPTVPPAHVPVGRGRTQEIGAAAIDLTRLGVRDLRFLRISSPHPQRDAFVAGDTGADLKVIGVEMSGGEDYHRGTEGTEGPQ